MNSRVVAFGACAVLAMVGNGMAFAADDKPDAEAVLKSMAGTWTYESHITGGEPMPAEQRKAMTVTFDGAKFTIKNGDKVVMVGTNKIDVSKTPYTIDATVSEGEGKGRTTPGIFAIDGDVMRACFDMADKTRPDKFASPAKSTFTLMVMKRMKK